ncbi:MAG: hypothetical protein ACLP8S_16675 [Solirubrobacteraceae bacterium]
MSLNTGPRRRNARVTQERQRAQPPALLASALTLSPFHDSPLRGFAASSLVAATLRLVGIDPERFELDQLDELPVMTNSR